MRNLRLLAAGLTLAAFLLPGLTVAQFAVPQQVYCMPSVYRDRVISVGWYEAVIRAAPGCTRPALVRKENVLTGSVIGDPDLIPLGEVARVWVFTHRLTYTLDGRTWRRAVVR